MFSKSIKKEHANLHALTLDHLIAHVTTCLIGHLTQIVQVAGYLRSPLYHSK